jgi:EAL domain-containing protein (putative c-di-GMP-specific phosphodiesterase class I)
VCAHEAELLPANVRCFINVFPYTLVHLSPRQFLDAFKTIPAPGRIGIEISEQQIVGDPSMLSDAAKAMKKLGFLIVMDDIGFGRSNLETFIALEPDVVKIDKRFVQGISRDANLQRFMQRTLNIMRNSGAEIIAEGIEYQEDLDVLKSMGVIYGQGFLWGKPEACQESHRKAA